MEQNCRSHVSARCISVTRLQRAERNPFRIFHTMFETVTEKNPKHEDITLFNLIGIKLKQAEQ